MKNIIVFIIFFLNLLFITTTFAAQNLVKNPDFKPESLEDLTKDLIEQKAKMDPFTQQKTKVDIESLGLDDVDSKNKISQENKTNLVNSTNQENKSSINLKLEEKQENSPPSQKKPDLVINNSKEKSKEEAQVIAPSKVTNEDLKNQQTPAALISKDLSVIDNKIDNKISKQDSELSIKKTENEVQLPTQNDKSEGDAIISGNSNITDKIKSFSNQNQQDNLTTNQDSENNNSSDIKKPSKSEIAASKRRVANQKKQNARLKKLENLRKQYLIDYSSNKNFELLYDEEEKIIPKKRHIDKFISYETPAPPIMDYQRANDNVHIPKILTFKDKIDNLFKSISSDDISYFKSIYSEIGQPNLSNPNGDTILTYSLLLQKHDVVAAVLSSGADPNIPNALGYTPLEIAIELADSKSLKLLADNNVDINYVDAFKRTYLMHAARVGFLPAVEFLIDKGADVNAMDEDGFSALAIAYRHKKDIIVKYLLKHGAKPWVEKPYDPSSQYLIKELKNRWKTDF